MVKNLTAIGNSLGIIIDRPILDLLRIDRETPLEVSTDGEALIIRPSKTAHLRRVRASAERLMDRHDKTLQKLAE